MAQLDRLESLARRGQKRTMIVMPDEPGFLELSESRVGGQFRSVPFVAIENDASPRKLGEGSRINVIGVGVRQNNRRDPRPACAHAA